MVHTPVLMREVRELLAPVPGEVALDATVGAGGHARALAEVIGEQGRLIGVDVDPAILDSARASLAEAPCPVELVRASFTELPEVLAQRGLAGVDLLLADLGVSSLQLDDAQRGFSFQHDGPLDMRMNPGLKVTAADLVNRLKERELGDLIFFNAQERASRTIARRICTVRRDHRITTTGRLAEVVAAALKVNPHARKHKIHPATRTFQALRIAVNDELKALERLLELAPTVLNPGGRIAVIAFHSLEDKLVKLDFRARKTEGVYEILTKKPVSATDEEKRTNPRARSAKLRVARLLTGAPT